MRTVQEGSTNEKEYEGNYRKRAFNRTANIIS